MSNRWKFQLVFGGMWALLVSVMLILIDLRELSLSEQLSSTAVYVRTIITFLIGVFGFAYFIWKQQVRRREKAAAANGQLPPQ